MKKVRMFPLGGVQAAVLAAALVTVPAGAQVITGDLGQPSATMTIPGNQIPAPEFPFGGVIKDTLAGSKTFWAPRVVPPKGAPNVLLIMTDDQGYGVSGTFGGVVPTPALDRVAKAGLRYTQFNSTALCSPTRAALLTGRNHHSVGFGVITELSTGFPGYDSIIGPDNATIGALLKGNGYATSWFGKNHNTPDFQYSKAGPFDQWPSGMGFDYFYGFQGGETDQWTPYLFQNNRQIFPWIGKQGYNLITDMADEAINYMQSVKAEAPASPWFVYYAPGGTHSPHNPKPEFVAPFKGKFDKGWNALREEIFANQKRLGVIPENAKLTDWPDSLPKWESLSADQKKLFARQAEVFAGYAAYTDFEIGRVIQQVEDMGQLDNTLIIYIVGDNGTSPEGTLSGTPNQWTSYNGILDFPVAEQLKFYEAWGSAATYPHMAVAWSWAFDTPFKWTKQIGSHFGGTRQGLAISWPNRIKDAGGIRTQFHHVIDIVPTILEATGIKAPEMVNGIRQKPIEGTSMAYTWDKANANVASTRKTQYFEMIANRGIYSDGWYANTTPPHGPWILNAPLPPIADYKWELYNIKEDYSQANDLAAAMPDKLKEMQALFVQEAAKYQVLPLDNRSFARAVEPRPSTTAGRSVFTYTGMNPGIPVANAPNILGKSYNITADVDIPQGGGKGVLATLGGRWGGWGLYIVDGKPIFDYNMLILAHYRWVGQEALSPGKHTIEFDYTYDGPGIAKGGSGVLKVDGKVVATGKQPNSIAFLQVSDETFDVGTDLYTELNAKDYTLPFAFNGKINKLVVTLGKSQLTAEEQRQTEHMVAKARD
ncbi:arylsulfatase [Variovorax sp. J22P168]|uniref:arylsulfatase n=1 Tax=Variovorax jilinensis TaxID=3053513 RepID=UPI0025751A67|nr:arylsulfatase [Variovorax sp. J22P168]MDM0011670.1 arylsulfatase [Variovorax sp. J22P168]